MCVVVVDRFFLDPLPTPSSLHSFLRLALFKPLRADARTKLARRSDVMLCVGLGFRGDFTVRQAVRRMSYVRSQEGGAKARRSVRV